MTVELDDIELRTRSERDERAWNRRERYRQIREERNLSKKHMAQELGVSRTSWWSWEVHGREPSLANYRKLHDLTGETYLWLRGE